MAEDESMDRTSREDESERHESAPRAAAAPRRRRKWPWIVSGVVLAPFVVLALWTLIALSFSYSEGERAGYVQKFSRKGWVCKTWEGELAMVNIPGAMQERWVFTVRNDSIAQMIQKNMGSQVALAYDEHLSVPTSCFGETRYFVTGVRKVAP
jgi:hypothetical protein